MTMASSVAASRQVVNLYRSLLRAHRQYLPTDMRSLGDAYVKSEFRLHAKKQPAEGGDSSTSTKTTTPEQLATFCTEWEKYLHQITSTGEQMKGDDSINSSDSNLPSDETATIQFGADLPENVQLSKEQQVQLEKLRDETSKLSSDQ